MKKKKKTKTIIRNHVRIVNTLKELDEKVFSDFFGALYSYKALREDFAHFFSRGVITEVNFIKFAAVLVNDLQEKKGRFKKILDIIMRRNQRYLKSKKYLELSMDDLISEINAKMAPAFHDTGLTALMMLVYYLSMNIFAGDDFERIKELYFIERDRINALELKKKKNPEKEKLKFELHDRLKNSHLEIEFNTYCNDSDFENPDEIDFLEIAEKFHCDYDADTRTYNRVKRGLLLFFFERFEEMVENNDSAEGVIDTVLAKMARINMFARQQRNLVSDRTRLKEENQKLLRKIKKLKRDITALTLPLPEKKTPDRLERENDELKKKNYYLQSKIESLENRVAELEEEKKANKEIKENITINHENPVRDGLELQDFFSIVISGGHWNSRTREEVLEEFPHHEFIFVPAERTIRNIDTIENADLVIFDTSSHSHGYYYLVKKKAAKLLHIGKSSPVAVKTLFNMPTDS